MLDSIDFAIAKYTHLTLGLDLALLREDAIAHLDGKKTLVKMSGKRPGKKCGKGYVSADKKCKEHSSKTESGKRKLTVLGKQSAKELAGKVRERKGLRSIGSKKATEIDVSKKVSVANSIAKIAMEVANPSLHRSMSEGYVKKISIGGNEMNASFWFKDKRPQMTYIDPSNDNEFRTVSLTRNAYKTKAKGTESDLSKEYKNYSISNSRIGTNMGLHSVLSGKKSDIDLKKIADQGNIKSGRMSTVIEARKKDLLEGIAAIDEELKTAGPGRAAALKALKAKYLNQYNPAK